MYICIYTYGKEVKGRKETGGYRRKDRKEERKEGMKEG
jgi:hypothetical protein